MEINIITAEKKIYNGKAKSVAVPGVSGSFQILESHAPIVSILKKGVIRIESPEEKKANQLKKTDKKGFYEVSIEGGIIEMNHNKINILAE